MLIISYHGIALGARRLRHAHDRERALASHGVGGGRVRSHRGGPSSFHSILQRRRVIISHHAIERALPVDGVRVFFSYHLGRLSMDFYRGGGVKIQ